MYAVINERRIPDDALELVFLELGGIAHIRGEAVREEARIEVDEILQALHEGDTVQFDVEDRESHQMRGIATINRVERNEEGVGTLMRIKFSIVIRKVP